MRIELPKRVAENIDRFSGRGWLLPRLLEWWDRHDERVLLLIGSPGTGKSMIQAWLAGFGPVPEDPVAVERLARLRGAVKGAHFCQASSRNTTPSAFAENIANQLSSSVTGFAQVLAKTLAERVQITATQTIDTMGPGATATAVSIGRLDLGAQGSDFGFDRAFTVPLKKLYQTGYAEPILLLVDALDEAQTHNDQLGLPDLLAQLADVPVPVRILATTRDEPRVLKLFHDVKALDLIKDADPDFNDVRAYAEARLAEKPFVELARRKDFAQRLSGEANGVFLYAAVVLDELLKRPQRDLPDLATYPLPKGLSGSTTTF
jgi:hypothetical protein